VEFLQWSFLDRDADGEDVWTGLGEDETAELEAYVAAIGGRLGRKLEPGRGPARALRLTIDDVDSKYRSVVWYAIVWLVDGITGSMLRHAGFRHYAPAQPPRTAPTRGILPGQLAIDWPPVFPPRPPGPLSLPWSKRTPVSPSSELGYWLRPHTSTVPNVLPVVFLHGVGIGLWPYVSLLRAIATGPGSSASAESIGILAIELLAVSSRIAPPPPVDAGSFARHLAVVLSSLGPGWERFVLVCHSYGSALATHVLHDNGLSHRVAAVVLVDPVSILLHLPDVAYNFTRRVPRRSNEWQLWYFASTDVGVAMALGRHFAWMECIIWAEELIEASGHEGFGDQQERGGSGNAARARNGYAGGTGTARGRRRAAVCLAERDIIVDTATVREYLEGRMHVEGQEDREACFTDLGGRVLWCKGLDHAQVMDDKVHREALARLVREFCIES
jgi:hypothetical protein